MGRERRLNQYRIGPLLGKGSAGTVELATDTETGVEYAMKEFSKSRLRKRKMGEVMRQNRERRRLSKGQLLQVGTDEEKADALALIRRYLLCPILYHADLCDRMLIMKPGC